jgi:hypothetical protein
MQAPDITYEFHVQGAHAHWSIHTDGVHITEATSESGVHVTGVNADAMFSMCRNALACSREYSVFHELSNKPHQLASAKEMVKALNEYIQSQESTEERN